MNNYMIVLSHISKALAVLVHWGSTAAKQEADTELLDLVRAELEAASKALVLVKIDAKEGYK